MYRHFGIDANIINDFISRIEVHTSQKIDDKMTQQIDIYYNAVGVIDIPTDIEIRTAA